MKKSERRERKEWQMVSRLGRAESKKRVWVNKKCDNTMKQGRGAYRLGEGDKWRDDNIFR